MSQPCCRNFNHCFYGDRGASIVPIDSYDSVESCNGSTFNAVERARLLMKLSWRYQSKCDCKWIFHLFHCDPVIQGEFHSGAALCETGIFFPKAEDGRQNHVYLFSLCKKYFFLRFSLCAFHEKY